ncbi:MAG: hypothetical protein ACFFC7_31960 [Candidatus Hermodarchaeota archaeon]
MYRVVANLNQFMILAALRYKRDGRSSYYKRLLQITPRCVEKSYHNEAGSHSGVGSKSGGLRSSTLMSSIGGTCRHVDPLRYRKEHSIKPRMGFLTILDAKAFTIFNEWCYKKS